MSDAVRQETPPPRVSMTTAAEPDGAPRVASLDVLRGLAILGILFMNINDMGASFWASFGDVRHIGWTAGDRLAWVLREVLANGTARALLEMLFGVGIVILTDRAAESVGEVRLIARYLWRNVVLFALGLIHMFVLLWPGDILHTYAVAALIAVIFRTLPPTWLLAIGLTFVALQSWEGAATYQQVVQRHADARVADARVAAGGALGAAEAARRAKVAERKAAERRQVADEDRARSAVTGSFATWAAAAWAFIFQIQRDGIEEATIKEAAATMLIGAALFRWGIVQGARSRRFYVTTLLLAYGFGLSARLVGAAELMRFDDLPKTLWFTQEAARLATTLGHVALVHLLLSSATGARLLTPFVAAGRTALTIYIAQTLICLWVLYPPFMLGLYGRQGWWALMLTALVINALLLLGANLWVRHFRIAPVEWVWRSIVERRRLPFRAPRRVAAGTVAHPA